MERWLESPAPIQTISISSSRALSRLVCSVAKVMRCPGEAQAFALADASDGRLLTDDGDARSFAKDQGVTVVGSVGVLLAAIDAGKITEQTADDWLSTWIDETDYYVPHRNIAAYR
jgi:predicted nucleic acid-binding protein